MCRKGAWAELAVKVTYVGFARSRPHGFKNNYVYHEKRVQDFVLDSFVILRGMCSHW